MSSALRDSHLQVESLHLRVGTFELRDISLSCRRGEYNILMGPTGSGKSSLMKCILGLHPTQKGRIYLNDRDVTQIAPECRRMGYLPQNYALFPHLNVEENLGFGLRAKKMSKEEKEATMKGILDILNIRKLRTRSVRHLSGGERQKVALGRALAPQPEIVLLDEPFSSIDEGAKRILWFDLKRIINEVGVTALHITHNLEEAYTLGERLSVLIDGELVQSGSNREIFESPSTESVARYLNYRNIFCGVAEPCPDGTRIRLGHFSVVIRKWIPEGRRVNVCIRPQDIKIIRQGFPIKDSLKRNVFLGKIVSILPLPEYSLIQFKIKGGSRAFDFELKVPAYIPARHALSPEKQVSVALWEPNIIVFEDDVVACH